MKSPQTPSIARNVIYSGYEGNKPRYRAAIIGCVPDVNSENSEVNLTTIPGFSHQVSTTHEYVPYDDTKDENGNYPPHTWHWPPRV